MRAKRLVIAIMATTLQIAGGRAQEPAADVAWRPWAKPPSAALATRLRHWRLSYQKGSPQDQPERGIFRWLANCCEGTVRLVTDLTAARIAMTPVAERTIYVRPSQLDGDAKAVTAELLSAFKVLKFRNSSLATG